jgi:hypothetical protein
MGASSSKLEIEMAKMAKLYNACDENQFVPVVLKCGVADSDVRPPASDRHAHHNWIRIRFINWQCRVAGLMVKDPEFARRMRDHSDDPLRRY